MRDLHTYRIYIFGSCVFSQDSRHSKITFVAKVVRRARFNLEGAVNMSKGPSHHSALDSIFGGTVTLEGKGYENLPVVLKIFIIFI